MHRIGKRFATPGDHRVSRNYSLAKQRTGQDNDCLPDILLTNMQMAPFVQTDMDGCQVVVWDEELVHTCWLITIHGRAKAIAACWQIVESKVPIRV